MVVVAQFFGVGLVPAVTAWFGVLFAAHDPATVTASNLPEDCAVICMATEPIIVWPIPPPLLDPPVVEAPPVVEIRPVEIYPG